MEHGGHILLDLREHDACVLFAFCFRCCRHGVLELFWDHDVTDFHRDDRYAPRACFLFNLVAEFLVQLVAMDGYVGQAVSADRVAKCCLRRHRHGVVVVLHFHAGFFRVPNHPEYGSIHIDGHEV